MILKSALTQLIICLLIGVVSLSGCKKESDKVVISTWDEVKISAQPYLAIPTEFDVPYKQPLATLGWEDGIEISKNGLNLYCIYDPGDLLSWTINSSALGDFKKYRRGPDFGMDLTTNPAGLDSWVQSDILISQRASINDGFTTWKLSSMARAVFSEGAPNPFENRCLVYTCNDKAPTYDVDIWTIDGYPNPSGVGKPLPGFPHTVYTEDNPHIERISADSLILMFDSDNYPNGKGSNDIWYSISTNNGTTWNTSANLSSVNTSSKEHQPYLFKDKTGVWYLYFSAYYTDGKLAIFRSKRKPPDSWDNWSEKELVVGAGNTAGIGEPSLTTNGDLSFVVVYENTKGTEFDKYDADPWFAHKK